MIFFVIFFVALFDVSPSAEYSNRWLIKGNLTNDDLHRLSDSLGFTFLAQLPTGLIVLSRNDVQKSSKRKAFYHTKQLLSQTKIEYVEQEKWIAVNQRQITSYPPRDPKWGQMWYMNEMKNVSMGIMQTWRSNFSGKGVSIAILDDGVDYSHIDLKDRYDLQHSFDIYDNDKDPAPAASFRHGTKCAGIALASTNNICVIGVAFEASLVAVRMIGPFGVLKSSQVQALTAAGVHVSSNSWGGNDYSFDGPSQETKNAFKLGVTELRGGRGVVYVFAAGNGGFDDNCNTDGYVNSIYTIAINAVTIDNDYPGYAEQCSAVLASAYSGNGGATTDISTTDVGQGCVTDFRGTSAATPLAAGILALVLEANPDLHWRDVQELIVRTSRSDVIAKFGKFKMNGAGRKVSDWFGYGLLDSTKLITAAANWTSLPAQHTCSSEFKTENQQIGTSYVSYVTTDGCNDTANCVNSIEQVEVQVDFDYTVRGYIELILESPSGTNSKLLTARNSDRVKNGRIDWTYMSVQHWGEGSVGQWKLKAAVKVAGEKGTLVGWKLTLYGTGVGCTKKEKDKRRTKHKKICIIIPSILGPLFFIFICAIILIAYKRYTNKQKTSDIMKQNENSSSNGGNTNQNNMNSPAVPEQKHDTDTEIEETVTENLKKDANNCTSTTAMEP